MFRMPTFGFLNSLKLLQTSRKIGSHRLICFRKYSLTKNLCANENVLESESDSENESTHLNDLIDLKIQILKAGLQFVPEHGWNQRSIALGAHSIGLSLASHSLIQDGGADLVHYFNISCNENLEEYLKQKYSVDKEKIDIQNYMEDALEKRLKMVIPYVSNWPEAMAIIVTPLQFPVASKNLLDLVDAIWYYSGDRSLNLTWYSKRLSLAMMYTTCELSLIQDKSPEFSDTFEFLQRRIETLIESSNFINEVSNSSKHLPEFSAGVLTTVRNIIGANRWFR